MKLNSALIGLGLASTVACGGFGNFEEIEKQVGTFAKVSKDFGWAFVKTLVLQTKLLASPPADVDAASRALDDLINPKVDKKEEDVKKLLITVLPPILKVAREEVAKAEGAPKTFHEYFESMIKALTNLANHNGVPSDQVKKARHQVFGKFSAQYTTLGGILDDLIDKNADMAKVVDKVFKDKPELIKDGKLTPILEAIAEQGYKDGVITTHGGTSIWLIVGIVAGVIAGLVIIGFLVYYHYVRPKKVASAV